MCQNISKEVLLAASENQGKYRSDDCVLGRGQSLILPLGRAGSKEHLTEHEHGSKQKKSNFGNQQCLRFHIWFIISLWHLITRCERYYSKMRQLLSYKMRQFYYNMRSLIQNVSVNVKRKFKYCNVNIFQLINFCNCRILNYFFSPIYLARFSNCTPKFH